MESCLALHYQATATDLKTRTEIAALIARVSSAVRVFTVLLASGGEDVMAARDLVLLQNTK